ncbi:hypothetical protein F4680DRAFT_412808 [Xylaria scruposa]|nr:hypothetical protein F4680DRAFT_412808 [Xylaria scruposa]
MSAPESIRARRQRLASVPRACEACKIRKIRCDRSHPCSNCRASGIACQQVASRLDTGPKPAERILQLEDHIAQLEDRLSIIERQNKDPVTTTTLPRSVPSLSSTAERESRASSLTSNELYQGSSSFATLSAEASEAVQTSALSNVLDSPEDFNESFTNLNSLIPIEGSASSLNDHYFSSVPVRLAMPIRESLPVTLVVSILQKLKVHGAIFLHGYAISDITIVEDICRRVCFPMDPVSIGLVTSMHGLLYCLLREFITLEDPLGKEYDLKTHAALCDRNFNIGIETYNVMAVPSFENVLALTMGVIKAQSEAKPFLACTLASAAANHCHTLGYHREKLYQADHTEVSRTKRRLFWTLYVFDKNMSLLLGRSSSFQDIEIDVHHPPLSIDEGRRPWDEWFRLAIRLAKVQGQIYDRLYSVAGMQSQAAKRRDCIESLKMTLYQWRSDLEQINSTNARYPQIFSLSRSHWDIMYYSTLTCLLRASATLTSGGEISSECFQAARHSLEAHLRCFSKYNSSDLLSDADFANWVLQTSSLTPFIVLLLHAIASTSVEDLDFLDEVVQTLRSTRQAGKSFERLYELCATFARLARRVVEVTQQRVMAYDPDTDSLLLSQDACRMPEYWLEILQNHDPMSDEMLEESNVDISTIFADWMNGQPSVPDISNANPGHI